MAGPLITDTFTFIGTRDVDGSGNLDTSSGVMLTGFPFRLGKVDVSGFDYWTTLGGFKKGDAGSPTTTQINDSWQNAGKLFTILYEVNAEAGLIGTDATINTVDDAISPAGLPFGPRFRLLFNGGYQFAESFGIL